MNSLQELAAEHQQFTLSTFEGETANTALTKLEEELDELKQSLLEDDRPALIEEYMDCIMCLLSSAARRGITAQNVHEVFAMKVAKNKARKWLRNPDGTYSHIKAPTT